MATRRTKNPNTGEAVEATVVDIESIDDRPVIIKLVDESVLRLKIDVIEIVRFDGEWDREGNPLYQIKSGTVMAILESPDHLKKPD